jgi:serine/threonine protein kinase/Tol biopolymer transport system component
MPIISGRRLGPYEILSAIGVGGMGEVYKARDSRLNRIVAIKVLPAHLADRPELRERFEREARTVASLNHPHICVLHDIGQQDGIDYLVMEYLEGETLAERLVKGSLPLEQVLQYAIEISDALDKAHRKGVTHRDLKPGNIILTKTGTKLLDFGLAKLNQKVAPATPLSQLPTATHAITAEGSILGTLQYMAPEQLEGKEVDARTDIFAFGAVVYQMNTGSRAFEGKSQASLIAKILETDPPPMISLQPMTPPSLDRAVRRCLAKEPDQRWQTASDLCEGLKWIAESSSQAAVPRARGSPNRTNWGKRLFWTAAALAACAIGGFAVWTVERAPEAPPRPVSRLTITLPPGERLALGPNNNPVLALSPNGTYLAYVAIQGGTQQLYVRRLDSLEARHLPGTEGAFDLFFSPDSQWLGFVAGQKLKKVSVNGDAVVTLADSPALGLGGSWGDQGKIALGAVGGIEEVSDAGGTPQPLTHVEMGAAADAWPEFLPNGVAVLFTMVGSTAQIAVQSLRSGERRSIAAGGTPHYAPPGHLVYGHAGTLMAVPFDAQRLTVTGAAVPLVAGVLQSPVTGAAQYSVSPTGSLVYVSGNSQTSRSRLVWVSRNGMEQPLPVPPHVYNDPRLSPDGRTIAIGTQEDGFQIWLIDLSRETLSRFTFLGNNRVPIWTPDGKHIAFWSDRAGPISLFWQRSDGSGGLERLRSSDHLDVPMSFSPDGQLLAFVELDPATGGIWVLRMSDSSAKSDQVRKAQPFLQTPATAPRFSPDGRWLAYVSEESGHREVYVQPYPGPGGKWQVSTDGGTEPAWNRNGRELFYRNGDKMMAADIFTQPSFTVGKPRQLFAGAYEMNYFAAPFYDVSADGQRFLMLKPVEQTQDAAPTQINIVLNWFEELKQKVPTGKK